MSQDANARAMIEMDEGMYGDDFEILLRRQGWHMTHCKPLLTDPAVIAVRKARHPFSLERGTAAWHGLLGENTFRKLLRAVVNKPRTAEELSKICGDPAKLNWYLALLEDGDIIVNTDSTWHKGPACQFIDNIGHTLEWYVAEWFRLELHAPARHGVAIAEVPRGGDLDVVAFIGDNRVMVECKSTNPKDIAEGTLREFLQRAADLNPEVAVLLIDSESSAEPVIERLNGIILDLSWKDVRIGNPSLPDDANLRAPTLERQSGFGDVYWGMRNVYVTNVPKSIDASLSAMLRLYFSKVRHLSFVDGDNVWDYVQGTVSAPQEAASGGAAATTPDEPPQ